MLIRTKLILRFTILVAGLLVAFSAFVYYFQAAARRQRFVHRMEASALLAARVLIRSGHPAGPVHPRDLLMMTGERLRIVSPTGQTLFAEAATVPPDLADQLESTRVRYKSQGITYQVEVSAIDRLGHSQLDTLRLVLVVGNVGTLLLIILAGWVLANQFLQPIARVVEQVEQITASNLSQRVDEGNRRDEIARLAITFNQMLTGVEQAFEAQKSFLSHASHELRTPLATLLGTLETSLAYDDTLGESKESIASGLEDVRHLIALTNGLLTLARADAPSPRLLPVRLDECLTTALGYAQAKYPGREVQFSIGPVPPAEAAEPFSLPGNAELLTTALFNLLDNACKYSQAAVNVDLGYADADTLQVRVQDSGPGIAPADQARLFEPLFRARSAAGRPGFGLGLPLAQKVVRLHGGQLAIESAAGEGTTATVRLPV
ncbi:HAMP domain-containing sensor histidine kinase [Hymenobacter sp. BT559]|uniref:HAMP domain-containing sensor histidine kinase n=1 Tax=Hymenobacter sp. BT559 TaxID=2795729 RepID=UPI0018EA6EAF|nr:HAMP domain-containing sensor histidine kinase [Hymenobacter sp. BT559]MBJ6142260.1 HAMP domain-containing histidine kinase [Hymenobacter sp. BT559]